MPISKSFLIPVALTLFSSCSLFHFFPPGAQNTIQQLADKKGWIQIGRPIENASYNSGDFSFDVPVNGAPYVAARNTNLDMVVYRFDGKWQAISSLIGINIQSRPVLHIVNTCPHVAMKSGNMQGMIYDFCSDPPQLAASAPFGSNFSIFDFKADNSERLFTAIETNTGGNYGVLINYKTP